MSTILGTGEVPIKAGSIPADNAMPIPLTFVGDNGVVHGVVVGGLTKRQELAGRFLAALLGANHSLPKEPIETALSFADMLLAATETK